MYSEEKDFDLVENYEIIKEIKKRIPVGNIEAQELYLKYKSIDELEKRWKVQELAKRRNKNRVKRNYIPIDEWSGRWIFDEFQPHITKSGDIDLIRPLSEGYCKYLWNRYISDKHRHLMLIEKRDDWYIGKIRRLSYNWNKDWNEGNIRQLYENLNDKVRWFGDEKVFLLSGRYYGMETTWEVFCNYWVSFLYYTQSDIMINPQSDIVLIFYVNGVIEVGKRVNFDQE